MQSYDVVVVGGGVIGLALASSLAKANFHVAVVDKNSRPTFVEHDAFDLRVSAINLRSKNFLDKLGVWKKINPNRIGDFQGVHVWEADGTGEIAFDADALHLEDLGYIVENSVLQHTLFMALESAPNVTFFYEQSVIDISEPYVASSGEQRFLTLANEQSIEAPLIVAADGAQSQLRQWGEFAVKAWDCAQTAIVTNVVIEKSHQNTAWQVFDTRGTLAFLPLPDRNGKHQASIVWSVVTELANELLRESNAEFSKSLTQALQNRLGEIQCIDSRLSFPLMQRFAKEYVKPSLLLIGDAAHTIHPLAGQGLNLGLRDVLVLSDELVRAKQRQDALGSLYVLKRYQRRCFGHNLLMLSMMEGLKRLFAEEALPFRWLRNQGMNWVNQLSPVKSQLMTVATGMDDDVNMSWLDDCNQKLLSE